MYPWFCHWHCLHKWVCSIHSLELSRLLYILLLHVRSSLWYVVCTLIQNTIDLFDIFIIFVLHLLLNHLFHFNQDLNLECNISICKHNNIINLTVKMKWPLLRKHMKSVSNKRETRNRNHLSEGKKRKGERK